MAWLDIDMFDFNYFIVIILFISIFIKFFFITETGYSISYPVQTVLFRTWLEIFKFFNFMT